MVGFLRKGVFFKYVLCFVLNNRDREEDRALLSKEHLVTRDLRLKSGPCKVIHFQVLASSIVDVGLGIYGLEWRPRCLPSKAYQLSRRSSAEARKREVSY